MTISTEIDVHQYRKPEINIDELFVRRWSPRAMSGQSVPDKDLMRLFEAARWAPSASNEQPWRFIYAKKGQSTGMCSLIWLQKAIKDGARMLQFLW